MSEYKTEIGNLDPGSRFYFPNDSEKVVWTVLSSKRKAANGNAVFIYCEDPAGKIIDYNSNRTVTALPGDIVPYVDPKNIHSTNKNMNNNFSHRESSILIYSTSNYSDFRMINGNRQLNERKINKIVAEINAGNDMLQYYPIQVKENKDRLDILDGQHRFFICKKLKRPVYYILVTEEKSLPEIAKINSNVEKWKSTDFINCYIQHGNDSYNILQKFLTDYGISLTVALQMLHLGHPGNDAGSNTTLTESFRNGDFKIQHLDVAEALAKECQAFAPFANCCSRSFVIAIYRIKKAGLITIPDLLEAYHKRQEMLTQQANFKAYINTLEQIVNVGKKNRIVIV